MPGSRCLGIAVQIDLRMRSVIIRQRTGDIRQVLRAAHTPEVHEWVVGLSTCFEPVVPIVAPFAARPQFLWQPLTTRLLEATTIIVVAVEIATGVPWELCRTSVCEETLPSSGDLKVKAVVAVHIIPDVRDLHNHALAYQFRVRAAPVPIRMFLIQELELEALPAVRVTREAVVTADCYGREAHAQPRLHKKGPVVRTRCGRASTTN